MPLPIINTVDECKQRASFLYQTLFFKEDFERNLADFKRKTNFFLEGDTVVRKTNNTEYTVRKYEEGSYLIVRYPSPTKPHWTHVSPDEIFLKPFLPDTREPLQEITMKALFKKIEKEGKRVLLYYPLQQIVCSFQKTQEKTYILQEPVIGIFAEISPLEKIYYRDSKYFYMYSNLFVEFIIV